MCGRFALWNTAHIAEHYGIAPLEGHIPAGYNIAPGGDVAAVVQAAAGPSLVRLQWGLIPSWAEAGVKLPRSINARSETVWTMPSFRAAIRARRCLVPANGFFEWAKVGTKKQPYMIRLEHMELFSMAGIWESWTHPETGEAVNSCAILTTAANEKVAAIHNRMPVIIEPQNYPLWLAPKSPQGHIVSLLKPFPAARTDIYPVGTRVNSPRNNDPDCIAPVPNLEGRGSG